jgi:hypothetical protein
MSDRIFRLILDGKKGGLVKGSTPSSAAKKAYKKLSAESGKSSFKFELQETTKDSKKKVYGPYKGCLVKDKINIKMVGGEPKYTKNEKKEFYDKYFKLEQLNNGYKYKNDFYKKYFELSKKILNKENPTLNEVRQYFINNPIQQFENNKN